MLALVKHGHQVRAEVGTAIFRTAFQRWTGQPDGAGLPARIREAAARLAASLGAVDFAAFA